MAAKKPAKKAAKKPAAKPAKKAPSKAAPAAKAKASSAAPAQAVVRAPAADAFKSAEVARAQLTKLPPLDAVTRTAFARQVTMPELARLGGQTVAVNVLRESGAWLAQIAEARTAHAELARRYDESRLAYFCERVLALEDQLVKEGVRHDAISSARTSERAAVEAARIERDHLIGILEPIVRGDPVTSGQLGQAKGDMHDDALGKALERLAVIVETWLDRARTDVGARALVKAFGLGDDDVARARAAGAALLASRKPETTMKRDAVKQDSPETNVLEGIVLAEMRVALSIFRAARTRDPNLPALIPGPGTRAALSASHPRKSAHAPAATAPAAT